MSGYFGRQLAVYAEYHRDRWNCVMHVFGIMFLFLAAVLPFSAWPVPVLGVHITVATILLLPIMIYWLLMDAALGLALASVAVLLLSAAAMIVDHVSAADMWSITVAMMVVGLSLQVVGHQVFERRAPALKDHPTHLLLGPMFVMAKLFIALGFRHDLAVLMEHVPQEPPRSSSLFLEERPRASPHQHS